MKEITSLQNKEIKFLEKLKDAKSRRQEGKFLAEGMRICGTLISNHADLQQLYCIDKLKDYALAMTSEDKITLVSEAVIRKISPVITPSGIVCLFSIPKQQSLKKITEGIVLDNIADPGNMGTLIRTAAALNIKSIVIIDGCDPWNAKVVQSSAGTISQVNIFLCTYQQLIDNKKNLNLIALSVSEGKNPNQIDYVNSLIVVGSEANGIDQELLEYCDEKITLPMPGNTESLNAGVAGSIAMYIAFLKSC